MNYRNELDECQTYFKSFFNMTNFRILFLGCLTYFLLSHKDAQVVRELWYVVF